MSILDPNWKYTNSERTNIRRTFAAEKKRLREIAERKAATELEAVAKVRQMKKVSQ